MYSGLDDITGFQYHLDWSIQFENVPPGVSTEETSVAILLSIWDIGYPAVKVDIRTMPPQVKLSIHPEAEVHPERATTKSAKRATARRRAKKITEFVQASNLEDGLD